MAEGDEENGGRYGSTVGTPVEADMTAENEPVATRDLSAFTPEDDIKTHMTTERTFFKWVWAALRLGTVGTFVLAFFSGKNEPYRLQLVALCWIIALGFMFYGLYQYSARRRAIMSGSLDTYEWQNPAGPVAITLAFTFVILLVGLWIVSNDLIV